jgi:hypothetical protein
MLDPEKYGRNIVRAAVEVSSVDRRLKIAEDLCYGVLAELAVLRGLPAAILCQAAPDVHESEHIADGFDVKIVDAQEGGAR